MLVMEIKKKKKTHKKLKLNKAKTKFLMNKQVYGVLSNLILTKQRYMGFSMIT